MKIYLLNRVVVAEAETMGDVRKLLSLEVVPNTKPNRIVPRKRQNRKECDVCGRKVKGLTLHKRLAHNLIGLKEADMRKMLAKN